MKKIPENEPERKPGGTSKGVDGERLWHRLEQMSRIGVYADTGSCRPALSDADRDARDLLASWARERGYQLRVDQIGNMFVRRPGVDPEAPPILIGSHLDTQPTGGRFDGVAGVLAAFEVLESLDDRGAQTRLPVEVVNWTNEEGARFKTGLTGSCVWSGQLSLEEAWRDEDPAGVTIKEELERIGYLGESPAVAYPLTGFLELHIEQGPLLETTGCAIGVVERIQNMARLEVEIQGTEAHAGTTPMSERDDPMRALAGILPDFYEIIDAAGPDIRFNVGAMQVEPGAINTVPGRLLLGVDLRHPEEETHQKVLARLRNSALHHCRALALEASAEVVWSAPGLDFDGGLVACLCRAAERSGHSFCRMSSGAGHDAMAVAAVAPAAMVFIPCRGGVSHNPAEWAEPAHLAAGADVLLNATLELGSTE